MRRAESRSGCASRASPNLNALEELFIVTGAREWNDTGILDELEKLELKRVRGGER